MRLTEYRKSETSDLVDAVFLDEEEHFWHLQLVYTQTANRPGSRPRIQVETLDKPPRIGDVAEGYRRVPVTGTSSVVLANTWFELMSVALRTRGGWEALMQIALR